jgi:hypothetical protein
VDTSEIVDISVFKYGRTQFDLDIASATESLSVKIIDLQKQSNSICKREGEQ